MKTLKTILALIVLQLFIGCNQNSKVNENENSNMSENSVTSENSSLLAMSETEKLSQKNPFIGNYFYVSNSVYSDFEFFFEQPEDEHNSIFYFKGNSTVIYYAWIGSWQKGVAGKYRFENGEIIMRIPYYVSSNGDGNFGGDITILNDRQITASVDGNLRCKFLKFTPE